MIKIVTSSELNIDGKAYYPIVYNENAKIFKLLRFNATLEMEMITAVDLENVIAYLGKDGEKTLTVSEQAFEIVTATHNAIISDLQKQMASLLAPPPGRSILLPGTVGVVVIAVAGLVTKFFVSKKKKRVAKEVKAQE